jgi:hypothetical protein
MLPEELLLTISTGSVSSSLLRNSSENKNRRYFCWFKMGTETHVRLHAKCLLLLFDLNKHRNVLINFGKAVHENSISSS